MIFSSRFWPLLKWASWGSCGISKNWLKPKTLSHKVILTKLSLVKYLKFSLKLILFINSCPLSILEEPIRAVSGLQSSRPRLYCYMSVTVVTYKGHLEIVRDFTTGFWKQSDSWKLDWPPCVIKMLRLGWARTSFCGSHFEISTLEGASFMSPVSHFQMTRCFNFLNKKKQF